MKSETRSDSPKTPSHILKAIDLFAGIGGIRKGFQDTFGHDFEVVFSSEIDPYAIKTYSANFGEENIAGDITKIHETEIPSFDICLAGFPCQAFSVGGKKLGFEDTRGTLFYDVARLCNYHKPMVIFCENVDNLVRHNSGQTFNVIINTFEEIGYNVFWKVLDSQDFGVAQQRKRIYIVAFRKDIDSSSFTFPEPQKIKKAVVRDVLEKDAVSSKFYISETYYNWLKRHKAKHEAKGHGFGYKILDLDGISSTLTASPSSVERALVIDRRQTDFSDTKGLKGDGKYNDEFIRRLTPREMARLQGFPDDFIIPVSNTKAYKQFGNSVTVPVIAAIAKQIKSVLDK